MKWALFEDYWRVRSRVLVPIVTLTLTTSLQVLYSKGSEITTKPPSLPLPWSWFETVNTALVDAGTDMVLSRRVRSAGATAGIGATPLQGRTLGLYTLRLAGPSHHVVRVTPPSRLVVGYSPADGGDCSCFLLHRYTSNTFSNQGGLLVTMKCQGVYLTGAGDRLGLTSDEEPVSSMSDSRLFRLLTSATARTEFIHVATGKYISHGAAELLLVDSTADSRARGHHEFQLFPCD